MDTQENYCLTCFQPAGLKFVNLHCKQNNSPTDVLRKHFWFTDVDFQQSVVCLSCWNEINSFHKFYESVQELHHNRLVSLIVKSEPGLEVDDLFYPSKLVQADDSSTDTADETGDETEIGDGSNELAAIPKLALRSIVPLAECNLEANHSVSHKYFCAICSKGYNSEVLFQQHIVVHDIQPKMKKIQEKKLSKKKSKALCKVCLKWQRDSNALSHHMLFVHAGKSKETTCIVCGHISPDFVSHKYHRFRNMCRFKGKIMEEFKCEVCGAIEPNFASYTSHRRQKACRVKRDALVEAGLKQCLPECLPSSIALEAPNIPEHEVKQPPHDKHQSQTMNEMDFEEQSLTVWSIRNRT